MRAQSPSPPEAAQGPRRVWFAHGVGADGRTTAPAARAAAEEDEDKAAQSRSDSRFARFASLLTGAFGNQDCLGRGRHRPCDTSSASSSSSPGITPVKFSSQLLPCSWDRKTLAEFLGVPDEEEPVRDLSVAHLSQIAYAAGHQLCWVSLPFINQAAGGDVSSYGILNSASALASLGGSICFGRIADLYGPRCAMFVAHYAAFAYSAILALATTRREIYLSILPCAAMHPFQATQLIAATRSAPGKQGHALGQTTFSYGLGFVLGASVMALGGKTLRPTTAAGLAAAVELAIIAGLMQSTAFEDKVVPEPEPESLASSSEERAVVVQQSLIQRLNDLFSKPGVPLVMAAKFGVVSAAGLVLNMVPQFALDPFGVSPAQCAALLAYTQVVTMATQFCAGHCLDEAMPACERSSGALRVAALGGGAVAMSLVAVNLPDLCSYFLHMPASWAIAESWNAALRSMYTSAAWKAFALSVGPLAAAQQVVLIAVSTELARRAPSQDIGLVLGIDMALYSATGIATPLAAAWLTKRFGFAVVPLAGAVIACGTVCAIAPSISITTPAASIEKDEDCNDDVSTTVASTNASSPVVNDDSVTEC